MLTRNDLVEIIIIILSLLGTIRIVITATCNVISVIYNKKVSGSICKVLIACVICKIALVVFSAIFPSAQIVLAVYFLADIAVRNIFLPFITGNQCTLSDDLMIAHDMLKQIVLKQISQTVAIRGQICFSEKRKVTTMQDNHL